VIGFSGFERVASGVIPGVGDMAVSAMYNSVPAVDIGSEIRVSSKTTTVGGIFWFRLSV